MGNESSSIIEPYVLGPHFAEGITLEDLIDRSLVHLYGTNDFANSVESLSSPETAEEIFNFIMQKLEETVPLNTTTVPPDLTEKSLQEYFINDVVNEYDGFHKSNLLFNRLREILEAFPYPVTLQAIKRKREDFVEKIHVLMSFIIRKKHASHHHSGIAQFTEDFGSDPDLLALEKGDIDPVTVIENAIKHRSGEIELVPCGEGKRFKCYRVKLRKKGKVGIEWDYTDLVIKVMKPIVAERAMSGKFNEFQREHGIVQKAFGETYIPDTHFNDKNHRQDPLSKRHPELSRFMVYQEYVNGESILGACKDPFLADHLAAVLPSYVELYMAMRDTHQRVIDCSSIAKRNVLVRRRLAPLDNPSQDPSNPQSPEIKRRDELRIQIVDTNNLTIVGSRAYERMFIDRKTGENHYLRRLQQYIRDKSLGPII